MDRRNRFLMIGCGVVISVLCLKGLAVDAAVRGNDWMKQLGLGKGQKVICTESGDVVGDRTKDMVVFYGTREGTAGSAYITNGNVAVIDGKTKTVRKTSLNEFCGYSPKLTVKDFTGDKKAEVLLVAGTGGSGGFVDSALMDFSKEIPQDLLAKSAELEMTGTYRDDYKVEMKVPALKKSFTIDVSANRELYEEMEYYSKDGKCLSGETLVEAVPFTEVDGVDQNGDGIYELHGTQKIFGHFNAERVSYVTLNASFQNGNWIYNSVEFSTFLK